MVKLTCINCGATSRTADEGHGLITVAYYASEYADSMGTFPGIKYQNGWFDVAGTLGVLCPTCGQNTTINLNRLF